MVDYTKEKVDWEFYFERGKNALFYTSFFSKTFCSLLMSETGDWFKKILFIYKDQAVSVYYSKKERQEFFDYLVNLVKNKDPKLTEWHKKGIDCITDEQELIKKFSEGLSSSYIVEHYDEIIESLYPLFLYLSSIPFMLLPAI